MLQNILKAYELKYLLYFKKKQVLNFTRAVAAVQRQELTSYFSIINDLFFLIDVGLAQKPTTLTVLSNWTKLFIT